MTKADSQVDRAERRRTHGRIAWFFLHVLFFLSTYATWFLRISRPLWIHVGWRVAPGPREALMANAARLLGPDASVAQRRRLSQKVIREFFDFVLEISRLRGYTREQLLDCVAETCGAETYNRVRQAGNGLILVTAHLGSFEVGMAALLQREPRLHVVFQPDAFDRFEQIRSNLRRRLGVMEAAADEGWPMWLELLEALRRDEVVLMQGDRVMPGQAGQLVTFMDGHIRMPTGPVRLAAMAGCPIMPVFAVRQADGRVRIILEQPVAVDAAAAADPQRMKQVLDRLAAAIERQVSAQPHQWLMFSKVWVEDQEPEYA